MYRRGIRYFYDISNAFDLTLQTLVVAMIVFWCVYGSLYSEFDNIIYNVYYWLLHSAFGHLILLLLLLLLLLLPLLPSSHILT